MALSGLHCKNAKYNANGTGNKLATAIAFSCS
ncbi:UNVERIFIED_ORG: hypothetical protein J2791_006472 [Burkholderia contaminans]|nr:hypothetical protein [Burkholderia contaminans]